MQKKIISLALALMLGLTTVLAISYNSPTMAHSSNDWVDLIDRGGDGKYYRLLEHSNTSGSIVRDNFAIELRGVGVGEAGKRQVFAVNPSGVAIANNYSTFSDRRLKDDINVLRGSLGKISQINGVSYQSKDSGERQIGVIAQEVEKVFPEAIQEVGEEHLKAVSYDMLLAVLIQSTKELKQQKDQEIAALLSRVEQLESQVDHSSPVSI